MGNKTAYQKKREKLNRVLSIPLSVEGSTQVSKMGVLIPVELQNMRGRCRGRCYSIGNGGGGFA